MRPNVKTTIDPLDLTMLPPTDGMVLDYRTQPETDAGDRARAIYRVVSTAVLGLVIVVLCRLGAASLRTSESLIYTAAMLFWFLVYPCFALLVLIFYLRGTAGRKAITALAIPALIWGLLHLVTVGYHPRATFILAFIPALTLAVWLSDRILLHYATWMAAHPLLDATARQRMQTWIHNRIPRRPDAWLRLAREIVSSNPPSPHRGEALTYPLSVLLLALALLLSLFVLLVCSAIQTLQLFAGMLAILAIPAILFATRIVWAYYARLDPIPTRLVCRLSWRALASWLTYNAHETPAPGVLRSPAGTFARRFWLWTATIFLLTLAILPVSAYFPLVLFFSGPSPWLPYTDAPTPRYRGPSQNLSEIARTLEPPDRVLYDECTTDAERRAYLRKIADERAHLAELSQEDEDRRAVLSRLADTPEAWLWIALKRTFTLDYLFSAAFFLSLTVSLLAAPLAFFIILTVLCGRLLVFYYWAVETPSAPLQAHKKALWDARVERLRTSPHAVPWMDATARERDHLWLGTSTTNDYPILLDRQILGEHAHILGSTGSGKTALGLAPLIAQLIRHRDSSIIVIDLKGDAALFTGVREEAAAAGLSFKWFTNELGDATYIFNPLLQAHNKRLTLHQRTELLMGAFGLKYGRFYGRDYFSDIQSDRLFRALKQEPDCLSFERLSQLLDHPNVQQGMGRKQIEDSSHICNIVERLASFPALNACAGLDTPQPALDSAIDISSCFDTPSVLYFFLPAALESVSVSEIGRLALYSILTAAATNRANRPQVYLFIDEFQQIVSSNLEIILRHARSMGIGMILANQTLPDLKTPEGDLIPIVASNTRLKQVFSVNDVFQQEFLSKASGETIYETVSRLVGVSLFSNEPDEDRVTGYSFTEQIGPRHRANDIIEFSNHPQRSLVHINRSSGFSQFGGYSFVMASKFHITREEYERRARTPWPSPTAETIVPRSEPKARSPQPRGDPDRRACAEDTFDDLKYEVLNDAAKKARENEGRDEPPPSTPAKPTAETRKKKKKKKPKKGDPPNEPREST